MSDGYHRPVLDEDKVYDDLNTFRWINLVFHVIRFIVALTTFGLCLWVRFDLDFQVWVREIDWYSYWYCMYIIMFAMACEVPVALFGALAVLKDHRGILLLCAIAMGTLFFFEFVGGIMIVIYGVEESPVLIRQLREVLLALVYKWDVDPRASAVLRQIMEYVGCCGADGSQDFIDALKPVPMECRDQITGVEYTYGCQQQLAWWLEPWTSSLAALSFFFCATGVAGMYTHQRLRKIIREFNMINGGEY